MKFLQKIRFYFAKKDVEIVREIFISIVISTLVSSSIAFYFNKRIDERVANRQFIYDFGRVFLDNPKYRNVSAAIEENYVYGKSSSPISEYDLDDYLGLLTDMWTYYKDGFISKELLTDQYIYYLCITYNSQIVTNYRDQLRKNGFSEESNYPFLDEMAEELNLKNVDCKRI